MLVNKQKLFWLYRQIKIIKPKYFFILALVFLVLGVHGLRQNSLETSRLKNQVIEADEKNGDIETALRNLREHVYSHMNTNLSNGSAAIKPPIQLKNRYEELTEQENRRIAEQNKAIKQKAEDECARQYANSGINRDRVNCIAAYVNDNAVKPNTIPSELYKFDFVSPSWTPDLAGVSLVLSVMSFLLFIFRFSAGVWYKNQD